MRYEESGAICSFSDEIDEMEKELKALRLENKTKDERIKQLEWAIHQALATPMIGELAKSILEPVKKG